MNPFSDTHTGPALSSAERDRRYEILRGFQHDHGLDALVVFGWGRTALDQYLTNEQQRAVVVMTPDGLVTSIVGRFPLDRFDEAGAAYPRWGEDFRTGNPATTLAAVLAERGVSHGTVGVVGLTSRAVGEYSGVIPHRAWQAVLSSSPHAAFVDVSADFETLLLVKSAEELDMIRYAAALGERACEAFAARSRAGALESAPIAAALEAIVSGGGWLGGPLVIERAGAQRFAWGKPEWMSMGRPRVLQSGDSIGAEIFAFYGGFESQQQIDVSIGRPGPLLRELEEVCAESYRRGIDALRVGASFADLCATMHEPLTDARVWNTGPLVQTVSPVIFNGATHVGLDSDPGLRHLPTVPSSVPIDGDFEIRPGIAFAFEPNAVRDGQRVCIGGTVLITDSGVEELNTVSNGLVVVDG